MTLESICSWNLILERHLNFYLDPAVLTANVHEGQPAFLHT